MTDIERAAFEEWFEAEIKPKMNRTTTEFMTKEIMFAGWQARASRPVVVTDEMVEAAAKVANSFQFPNVGWSDLREPYKQRLIGRVRQVLSAALNGGTD